MNLRTGDNIFRYPTMAEMRHYGPEHCRQMIKNSDVIVFHSAVRPFIDALNLTDEMLKDKKAVVYFHGSELRGLGRVLLDQADTLLNKAQIVVSTPDLFYHAPDAKWLPVCRSFSEITRRYGICNQDEAAKQSFGVPKQNVVFTHAPSSEFKKGSTTFYRVITKLIKELPYVNYLTIQNQPWRTCLHLMSQVDVHLGQDPPFTPGPYGQIDVEASIYKIPTITKLASYTIQKIKELTGRNNPFIIFQDEEDLYMKTYRLATEPKLRQMFGKLAYKYCKAVHDEKPVVDRFLQIIEEMD